MLVSAIGTLAAGCGRSVTAATPGQAPGWAATAPAPVGSPAPVGFPEPAGWTTTTAPSTATSTPAGNGPVEPAAPTPLPVAPVQWAPCATASAAGLQCGSVTVPLDYADPSGSTIEIAVARHPAASSSQRIGSLVVNPGGPGVSGIDDLPDELSVMTATVLDDFDVVSFDPRGVQRSDPVTCGNPPTAAATAAGDLPDPVPVGEAATEALEARLRTFAAACREADGSILRYVGTVDTARDLDRIRAALGDGALTFMGQSYGTLLGATYAGLFPTHVRAMVLDGAIDPSLSLPELVRGQAGGFEDAWQRFVDWCAGTPSCPWRPAGDPTAAVQSLVAQVTTQPLPGGNTRAGPAAVYDALLDGLYSRADWPTLADALAAAGRGDGSALVAMTDHYLTGGGTNAEEANVAVNCLDYPAPRSFDRYVALAAADAASAPVFGALVAWGAASCAVWPVPASRTPGPVRAAGTPPILVVGTTGDPATPYRWAVDLAGQLQHGVLLTRDGDDHVAYFSSACVRSAVAAYLVDGTVPAAGAVCTG